MTWWLVLWVLGLATTGLIYPNYQWVTDVVNTNEQIIQRQEDEAQRNFMAEQEEIIIEDYFLFLNKIGKIKYARWCMGEYTPPTRSEEKQKRVKCSDNAFDCAGLIKGYAIAKGILSQKEVVYYNSQTLMDLAQRKDARLAQRWDRTSRQGYGDRSTWNLSTHFAMISRDYTGGNILWIYDNVNGPNNNRLWERAIRVSYNSRMNTFHYMGKYRIAVYTNWLVNAAQKRWITVERRYDTDPQEETIQVDSENPLRFSVTVKWFDYDSIANRVASFWYDHSSGDLDMLATFVCENGWYNINSRSPTRDSGLCQLQYNKTNKVRIDDPRRKTREFQAQVCLDKRKAVASKDIRACYAKRASYKDKFIIY